MRNYEMIFKAAKGNNREAFRELFFDLHIKDRMELYHSLYPQNKERIEEFLTPEEFAEIFEWMAPREQERMIAVYSNQYIAKILPYMESDNIVKFLSHLQEDDLKSLLALLTENEKEHIAEIMSYDLETAGSIMNKSYVAVSPEDTVQDTINKVRNLAQSVEMLYYVYVVDEGEKLIGLLSLRDLILHAETKDIMEIVRHQFVATQADTDQEEAALLLQEYDLMAIPVLDEEGRMLGIITADDIMDIIMKENLEDFREFAAISKSSGDPSVEASIWGLARVRMPWIVLLIFLGMLSANLISSFEDTLSEVVLLAAFIPIIMDSAGNVGTQSLAVAVRDLTTNEAKGPSLARRVWQEFVVGVLLGLAAGITLGLIVAIYYGNTILAIIIAVSLLVTLSISTVVGALIPFLINKMRIDPAVASGPFITTINDTVGLLIYFTIATQLLHLL